MCCETVHYIIYKHFWRLSSRYSSFGSKVKRCCKIGLRFCLQSKHRSCLASHATSGPAAESCPTAGAARKGKRGVGVVGKSIGVRVTEKHFLSDPKSGEADQVA